MKSTSEIIHYASKQDYLNRKPSVSTAKKVLDGAKDLGSNKKSSIEEKAKDVSGKVKEKALEAKDAGKHLLSQAVTSGLRSIPLPSLPGIPGIPSLSIGSEGVQETSTKLIQKQGPLNKPAIFFVKGFELNPFADEFNSIGSMAQSIPGAKVFNWGDGDEVIAAVKEHATDQPVILVGEGMGSDTIVSVANRLNTSEGSFRNIDLLVTLNSVGTDNDIISNNVKKNVNFISDVDSLFNDGPNIARDKNETLVQNELRSETPQEFGESADIQFSVFQEINETLVQAVTKKNWKQMQVNAFKDSLKSLGLRPNLFV